MHIAQSNTYVSIAIDFAADFDKVLPTGVVLGATLFIFLAIAIVMIIFLQKRTKRKKHNSFALFEEAGNNFIVPGTIDEPWYDEITSGD